MKVSVPFPTQTLHNMRELFPLKSFITKCGTQTNSQPLDLTPVTAEQGKESEMRKKTFF